MTTTTWGTTTLGLATTTMSDPNNTDNVEAFLFELNDLLERHKASIQPAGGVSLRVTANGHSSLVLEDWNPETRRYNPRKLVIDTESS